MNLAKKSKVIAAVLVAVTNIISTYTAVKLAENRFIYPPI